MHYTVWKREHFFRTKNNIGILSDTRWAQQVWHRKSPIWPAYSGEKVHAGIPQLEKMDGNIPFSCTVCRKWFQLMERLLTQTTNGYYIHCSSLQAERWISTKEKSAQCGKRMDVAFSLSSLQWSKRETKRKCAYSRTNPKSNPFLGTVC